MNFVINSIIRSFAEITVFSDSYIKTKTILNSSRNISNLKKIIISKNINRNSTTIIYGLYSHCSSYPVFVVQEEINKSLKFIKYFRSFINSIPKRLFKRYTYHLGKLSSEFHYNPINREIHRDDGPAIIRYNPDGTIESEEYYQNNRIFRSNDLPSRIDYFELGNGVQGEVETEHYMVGDKYRRANNLPALINYLQNYDGSQGQYGRLIFYNNDNEKHRDGDVPADLEYYSEEEMEGKQDGVRRAFYFNRGRKHRKVEIGPAEIIFERASKGGGILSQKYFLYGSEVDKDIIKQ